MDVEVHRAGSTFYVHYATLLNLPDRKLDRLLNIPEWPALAAAKLLGLPEVAGKQLIEFRTFDSAEGNGEAGLSEADLAKLMQMGESGALSASQLLAEMQALQAAHKSRHQRSAPKAVADGLFRRTGVPFSSWKEAGQEILEAVMPLETGQPRSLLHQPPTDPDMRLAQDAARRLGLADLVLVSDFPIVTATYGYTRTEFGPKKSASDSTVRTRLNSFPAQRDYGGKVPIFVDDIRADALLLSLDASRVHRWLDRNDIQVQLPNGSDPTLAQRGFFVELFRDVPLRETLQADQPAARMVFGLLHTFSHLAVRHAALLCGLDRTSLSEYMLPRALTFAIYSNHRFGATIGALTALFEQAVPDWLDAVRDSRHCVYDPVCREQDSSCHACTHLSETSCRFFNLNLGRAFLFGGHDPKLGDIKVGYLDASLMHSVAHV